MGYLQIRLLELSVFWYAEPLLFRWHVNAFLLLARSLTLWLQGALNDTPGFRAWWLSEIVEKKLNADPLLAKFKNARNIVIHARSLKDDSLCVIGLFKHGRKIKWTSTARIDPLMTSEELAAVSERMRVGGAQVWLTDEMQQRGALRFWRSLELGEDEIAALCTRVFTTMQELLLQVHQRWVPLHAAPQLDRMPAFVPHIMLFPTSQREEAFNGWSMPMSTVRDHEVSLTDLLQSLPKDPEIPKCVIC